MADYDGDGDLDVFVEVGGAVPGDRANNLLFRNPGHGRHWLDVKLVGTRTNRAAIGAKIRVDFTTRSGSARSVFRQVGATSSYGGSSLVEHIGLGRCRRRRCADGHLAGEPDDADFPPRPRRSGDRGDRGCRELSGHRTPGSPIRGAAHRRWRETPRCPVSPVAGGSLSGGVPGPLLDDKPHINLAGLLPRAGGRGHCDFGEPLTLIVGNQLLPGLFKKARLPTSGGEDRRLALGDAGSQLVQRRQPGSRRTRCGRSWPWAPRRSALRPWCHPDCPPRSARPRPARSPSPGRAGGSYAPRCECAV